MALTRPFEGTATIGTTELSILVEPNGSTTLQTNTTDGVYEIHWNVSALAAGDQFRFRLKEKINAGSQLEYINILLVGPQTAPMIWPGMRLGDGWDATVVKVAGTDRSISWSVRMAA